MNQLSAAVLDPENYSYKEREHTAPELKEGETLIFDEPGRVLQVWENYRICYRSHYFRVIKLPSSHYVLRVKHRVVEEIEIGFGRQCMRSLELLDSDSRFMLFWGMFAIKYRSAREASAQTAKEYREAFAAGRLKKRKMPRRDEYKVWID